MQNVILACAMLAFFALGYFIVKRVDAFITANQRAIEEEGRKNKTLVRIAAETPALVHSAAPAMEYCAWSNPYLGFSVSSGSVKGLLQSLREGTVDILLLAEDAAEEVREPFASARIPYRAGQVTLPEIGLPVENCGQDTVVYVLWDPSVASSSRDRVLFALCRDGQTQENFPSSGS